MDPQKQTVTVRKEYPPLGTHVEGQGTVTAFNGRGLPVVTPEGSRLGHLLEEGTEVVIFQESERPGRKAKPNAMSQDEWNAIAFEEGIDLS